MRSLFCENHWRSRLAGAQPTMSVPSHTNPPLASQPRFLTLAQQPPGIVLRCMGCHSQGDRGLQGVPPPEPPPRRCGRGAGRRTCGGGRGGAGGARHPVPLPRAALRRRPWRGGWRRAWPRRCGPQGIQRPAVAAWRGVPFWFGEAGNPPSDIKPPSFTYGGYFNTLKGVLYLSGFINGQIKLPRPKAQTQFCPNTKFRHFRETDTDDPFLRRELPKS